MSIHQPTTEVQPASCQAYTTAYGFPWVSVQGLHMTSSDPTLRIEGMLAWDFTLLIQLLTEAPTGGMLGLRKREERRQRWLSQASMWWGGRCPGGQPC